MYFNRQWLIRFSIYFETYIGVNIFIYRIISYLSSILANETYSLSINAVLGKVYVQTHERERDKNGNLLTKQFFIVF